MLAGSSLLGKGRISLETDKGKINIFLKNIIFLLENIKKLTKNHETHRTSLGVSIQINKRSSRLYIEFLKGFAFEGFSYSPALAGTSSIFLKEKLTIITSNLRKKSRDARFCVSTDSVANR